MGKFARSAAHVKNVTADPIATGSKALGRGVRRGFKATTSKVGEFSASVKAAEAQIEAEKAIKAAEKHAEEVAAAAAAQEILDNMPKVTKPSKSAKA